MHRPPMWLNAAMAAPIIFTAMTLTSGSHPVALAKPAPAAFHAPVRLLAATVAPDPRQLVARAEYWRHVHDARAAGRSRRAGEADRKARAARAAAAAQAVVAYAKSSGRVGTSPAPSVRVGGIWQCIADHEGSPPGNWSTDTGNGFYGGLQFTEQTWLAYGGGAYASWPQDASAGEQITVGERVAYAGWKGTPPQGWGAWPLSSVACGQTATVSAQLMVLHRRHHHRHRCVRRRLALRWARTQRGHGYCWGGTGPCYDCSGLVMMAYRHAGYRLPRTTSEMQDSRLLRRIRHPRPGDIVLYGWPAYHAALYAGHGRIFDALDSGTPVGSQPDTWPGSPIFYRVAGANRV